MRPKRLDIFILKSFLLLFVAAFAICLFVLLLNVVWRYAEDLVGKGLNFVTLASFFWEFALTLVPQALPLAVLMASLITFGNLGESSELTAIKAAGISLMKAFRPLIAITVGIMMLSFYFQNVVAPNADNSFTQLLLSMKQKSPEMEIPEGIFYDGIPQTSLYVQKKDMRTGMLYGMMIYRLSGSYEDAAIILADSGMIQSTAEKKHLVLTLYSGEWFENMRSQDVAGSAAVPYRRETFVNKKIVLDFDADFSLADASALANNARGKSLERLRHDVDSLHHEFDSIGHQYYADVKRTYFHNAEIQKRDSARAVKMVGTKAFNIDSVFSRLPAEDKQRAMARAVQATQSGLSDLEFKSLVTSDADRLIRIHYIEAINKFTLSLSCLIFFFIGAPLGAIIRKGGLGIPVIVSVLVFIVYYIFDNTGYRMSRNGMWAIWFGKGISTAVLAPLAVFFTYKANNDSVVFNMDLYRNFFMKLLGLRLKRHVFAKEVIIYDPNYAEDARRLAVITDEVTHYAHEHKLVSPPSIVKVFFKYEPDHEIERIVPELEEVIEDLSNVNVNKRLHNKEKKRILTELNHYPVVSVKAHTRPFERRWLNVLAALIVPVGICLYIRMWMFRLRLYRDLKTIKQSNGEIIAAIRSMGYTDVQADEAIHDYIYNKV